MITVEEGGIVRVGDEEVRVSQTEFALLRTFLANENRVLSRTKLLETVWNLPPDVATKLRTRTVDMTVSRLRTKLGEQVERLETIRGFGYRFLST